MLKGVQKNIRTPLYVLLFCHKQPIQFSSIYDENQLIYTKSLDSLDIIAIPTMQQLPAIKKRLKDFSRYRVKNNTTFIRDDILIYIQSYDSFFFYTKNDQQQWNLYQIDSLFEFIFYLANHFKSLNCNIKCIKKSKNLYRQRIT